MTVKTPVFQNDFLIFGIILLFSLLVLFLDSRGSLLRVKSTAGIGISPITSSLYTARANGFGISSSQTLKKDQEIEDLQNKNADLLAQIAQLKNVEEENQQMRRLLGTNLPPSWRFAPAKVVTKNADTITLVSDEEGQEGEFIILPGNEELDENIRHFGVYVGKIDNNQKGTYLRTLLPTSTFSKIAVSVRSKDTFEVQATGILVGRGSRALLDQILVSQSINEGDLIITEGGNGSLGTAEQLLIGKVSKVIVQKNNTFKQAEVSLIVDPTKLSRVFLVTKK